VRIGTPDQAIRTPEQKAPWRSISHRKAGNQKAGSSIKRTERAIILFDTKGRQKKRMSTSST
jgi:hypothetical protein